MKETLLHMYTVKTYPIWKENSTVDIKCSGNESISSGTHWHGGHCLHAISKDLGLKHKLTYTGGAPSTAFLNIWHCSFVFCVSVTRVNSDYLKGQAKQWGIKRFPLKGTLVIACQEKHNWSCSLQIYGGILSKDFLNKVAELLRFSECGFIFFWWQEFFWERIKEHGF